ncbi:MAG: RsmG family class I SAM-dependent methyltransferase, partial [Armatimonadota bacterium]
MGPPAETAIDIGSGAGFPGLPMKIVRPGLKLTLLEAHARRA